MPGEVEMTSASIARKLEELKSQVALEMATEYQEAAKIHDVNQMILALDELQNKRDTQARERYDKLVHEGEYLKTAAMFRLEHQFKRNIYELLASGIGSGMQLATKYGVSESVISRWRKKLDIKVDNPGQFKPVVK